MWPGFIKAIHDAIRTVLVGGDNSDSVNVTLVGGAVGGQTVAQGDPNAGGADAWPVAGKGGEQLALSSAQTDGTQRSNPSPSTPYSSSALEKSCVLKASAGTFRSLMVQFDPALASGTYYVQLLTASATVPGDGAVTFLRPPQTVVHVLGQAEVVNFFEGDSGITFTVGCTACVSTSQFTKTLVGSNCAIFAGSVL